MFTLSNTTWVLIIGLFFIKSIAIAFLRVALSRAHNTMLESTKKSVFISFRAVKFKIAHIYAMLFPKAISIIVVRLITFVSFDGKSDYFYLLANKFFRKLNSLFSMGWDDNFSVHFYKKVLFSKYINNL